MIRRIVFAFLFLSWLPLLSGQVPPIRILPLGDSITLGYLGVPLGNSVFDGYGGYRETLRSLLTTAGYNVDFVGTQTNNSWNIPDQEHEGHSGWTIGQIDSNIVGWLNAIAEPDVVLLHLGTNDFGTSNPDAINRLDALILKIATLRPNAHIIVTNLLERAGLAETAIQTQFNPFVQARVNAHAAAGRRVTFLDMRAACPFDPYILDDTIHPNQAGYDRMADAWFSAIWKVISPLGQDKRPAVDLNGDGLADLLFQNSSGQIHSWFLDGTGNAVNFQTGAGLKPGSKNLYSASLGTWRIVGMADINTDGFQDLVLQDSVGKIFVWFLDGSGNAFNFATLSGLKPGSKALYSQSLGQWRIVGVNDLNIDGFADLVFQNTVGQIYVWFLDGTGDALNFATGAGLKPGSKLLFSAGLGNWRVVGVNDFNGDGIPDLIFQNTIGQIYAWFLDGTGNELDFSTGSGLKPGSKVIYSPSLGDSRVGGTQDINNDGSPDLVFQNTVGQIFVWFLDGTGSAIDFSTGSGLKPGSKALYPFGLGDWRIR